MLFLISLRPRQVATIVVGTALVYLFWWCFRGYPRFVIDVTLIALAFAALVIVYALVVSAFTQRD